MLDAALEMGAGRYRTPVRHAARATSIYDYRSSRAPLSVQLPRAEFPGGQLSNGSLDNTPFAKVDTLRLSRRRDCLTGLKPARISSPPPFVASLGHMMRCDGERRALRKIFASAAPLRGRHRHLADISFFRDMRAATELFMEGKRSAASCFSLPEALATAHARNATHGHARIS